MCQQILEVNELCSVMKKAGIPFLILLGGYSCALRSNAKNAVKNFEDRYKLASHEVIRLQFDTVDYIKDKLQLGPSYKHVSALEDYWANCVDEVECREGFFYRMIVDQVKLYGVNINMGGVVDDGQFMQSSTYLNEVKNTPIDSTPPLGPTDSNLEVLTIGVIKRIDKWVEWTRAWRKRTSGSQSGSQLARSTPPTLIAIVVVTTSTSVGQS